MPNYIPVVIFFFFPYLFPIYIYRYMYIYILFIRLYGRNLCHSRRLREISAHKDNKCTQRYIYKASSVCQSLWPDEQ